MDVPGRSLQMPQILAKSGIKNLFISGQAENMKELCRCVRADVDAFVGDAPQFDDITMLAFRYKP